MAKRSVTIRAAWIGFWGSIVAAAIGGLFLLLKSCENDVPSVITPKDSNTMVIIDSTVEGNVTQNIVPRDQVPQKDRPIRFDMTDPKIEFMKRFDLRKEGGASLAIGACPKSPCAYISFDNINLSGQTPLVEYSVWGNFPGFNFPKRRGVGLSFPLMKRCGVTYSVPDYLFMLEITDDTVSTMSATLAIKKDLSFVEGFKLVHMGCLKDK